MIRKRILSLLVCAALLCGVLAGLQHLFRQHCRFQLFRFCKREHPLFHCDRRHWQGGPAGRRRELPVLPL